MLQERTWRSVTDRSKAADAAATTNNSGAARAGCSAARDAFDLSWTVKHSNNNNNNNDRLTAFDPGQPG